MPTIFFQSNVLIDLNGVPKIIDFGLSKISQDQTSTEIVGHGTYLWSAPEIFNGISRSFASDVYAVSMIIVEVSLLLASLK